MKEGGHYGNTYNDNTFNT